MKKYGNFESFDAFLESYKEAEKKEFLQELLSTPRGAQPLLLKKKKERAVVEIEAVIVDDQGQEGDHYHKVLNVTSIMQSNPSVDDDLNRCLSDQANVFLAVRFGDSMGLSEPIESAFGQGDALHLQGEWIPQDKAFNHGGEKMSVIHFTHHPLGFTCTTEKCYS